jgi:LmbE family N-acetylglucosaminyl deacetylase
MCAATSVGIQAIRFIDSESQQWFWTEAPCFWFRRSSLEFLYVSLSSLESSGSVTHPQIVSKWIRRLKSGRAVPGLVVSKTEHGTFFVHDGNHRLQALRTLFTENSDLNIRVALVVPQEGFRFRFRRYGNYATHRLEPRRQQTNRPRARAEMPRDLLPLASRTLVLVAHPDDETGGCAGLLQRIRTPLVCFATEGAPSGKYFWNRFGSSPIYARVRRAEATGALSEAGVKTLGFLGDWVGGGVKLRDQELSKFISLAMTAAIEVAQRFQPDAVLVPAYEGGHPDHDVCSFLGYLLKLRLGLDVWEMPLYHRGADGNLVCRRFRSENGTESTLTLTKQEREIRRRMITRYCSQWDLPEYISTPVEYIRPQAAYDYSQPPHRGLLNYQVWQWPTSPGQVCQEFEMAMRGYGASTQHLEHVATTGYGKPPSPAIIHSNESGAI